MIHNHNRAHKDKDCTKFTDIATEHAYLLCRYFRHTRLCYTRYLLYALVIRQLAEVADVEQMLLALQLQLLKKTTDDTELQHIARCCTIITQ